MPLALLQRLSCIQLPTQIEAQGDIDKMLLLRAAGLIEADLPPAAEVQGRHLYAGQAIVMALTRRGQLVANGASLDTLCSTGDRDGLAPTPVDDVAPTSPAHPVAGLPGCRA